MAQKKTAGKAPAKPMTKSEILSGIADSTGLARKQVSSVFEAMAGQIQKSLSRSGPGVYTVPGLMKLVVVRKPAVKAHKGIPVFYGFHSMSSFVMGLVACMRSTQASGKWRSPHRARCFMARTSTRKNTQSL